MPFELREQYREISINVTYLIRREEFPCDKRPCSMSIWSQILNSSSGRIKRIIALKHNKPRLNNEWKKVRLSNLELL